MNEPRRTMSEVLRMGELPPEAASFLKGTPQQAAGEQRTTVEAEPRGHDTPALALASSPKPEVVVRTPVREEPIAAPPGPVLVSMTFRLPAVIPSSLIRAAADRKLARQPPSSQQDIVAEALTQWLKQHGY